MKIAVLDDYQTVAAGMPAVAGLEGRASVTAFADHLSDHDALVARLEPFDCIIAMRERTPLPRALLAGAALDVYEHEPLPAGYALLQLPNLLATPHIGYVTQANYDTYFREAVEDIEAWLDGRVLRPLNTPSNARSPGGAGQA